MALKHSDFCDNPSKRQHIKVILNSTFGKFGQKPLPSLFYVTTQAELENLLEEGNEITGIVDFGDICQVQCHADGKDSRKSQTKSNCLITAFICALSRIDMHSHMLRLLKQDSRITLLYTDTDNLLLSAPKNVIPDLPVGYCFGDFRPEFGTQANITSFRALGKKNISVTYEIAGKSETIVKVRGMSLLPSQAHNQLQPDSFKKFLNDHEQGLNNELVIPQVRKQSNAQKGIGKKIQQHHLGNHVSCDRWIDYNSTKRNTYPWGYNAE